MNNELVNLTNIPTPTLTLEPVADDAIVAQAEIIETDVPVVPSLADSLTADELAQVNAFAQQIDVADTQQVIAYGSGAQKKMKRTRASSACSSVRPTSLQRSRTATIPPRKTSIRLPRHSRSIRSSS